MLENSNLFSVVFPTMWRIKETVQDLRHLEQCNFIGEIILINNSIKDTPPDFDVSFFSKIIEVRPPQNLYINPSWNLGIRMSKFDKIMIKSDDTFFDYEKSLFAISQELNNEDSLIGTYLEHNNFKIKTTNETEVIFTEVSKRNLGFGCSMFLNKQSFVPINDKLLIWYGDDFMTESYTRRGLKLKTIRGININGYIAYTINHVEELIKIKYKDEELWNGNKEILFKECNV
jgi:hypothetical protein